MSSSKVHKTQWNTGRSGSKFHLCCSLRDIMLLKSCFVSDHSYHSIRAKMAGTGHSAPTPPTVFLTRNPKAESRQAELVIYYYGFEGSA